jgi:WD40 repeat protein
MVAGADWGRRLEHPNTRKFWALEMRSEFRAEINTQIIASWSSHLKGLSRLSMGRNLVLALSGVGILALSSACQTPTDGVLLQELKHRSQVEGVALVQAQTNFLELLSFDDELQGLPNPRGASKAWFSGDGKAVAWTIYTMRDDRLAACPFPVIVEVLGQSERWQLPGNVVSVRAMAVSSSGKQVAFDGTYRPVGAVDPTPRNSSRWITGLQYIDSTSNTVRLILPLPEGQDGVTSISFSPDGTQFVYDYHDRIFVYNTSSGSSRSVATGASPTWSPNGRWIAFRSANGEATTLNASTFETEALIGNRKIQSSVHWSPDSRYIMVAEPLGLVSSVIKRKAPFFPPTAQMVVERIEDHATDIVFLFDPDGIDDDRGFYWIPDHRAFMRAASTFPTIKPCD